MYACGHRTSGKKLSGKPSQNHSKSVRQLALTKGMGVFYFSIKKMVSERSEFIFI
jgi:hypothetical protein